MLRTSLAAGVALALPLGLGFAVEARPHAAARGAIVCQDEFQSVEGQQIATPYCEDSYIAKVAREHGHNVSGAQLRRNPGLKDETCRLVDADKRVGHFCGGTEDND